MEEKPRDRVKVLVEQATRLLDSSPDHSSVVEFIAELEALPQRDLVRFDGQSRSWYSGLSSKAIARLRWPALRGGRKSLWEVLALVSADGRERQRGIRATPFSQLTACLLTIRATDWVGPVRAAALHKLDECPLALLIEALPLADQLATQRIRGEELHLLLDRQVSEEALREAARTASTSVRRAALRRLVERGTVVAGDVANAVDDEDVMVRMSAASALERLEVDQQRRIAQTLIDDPVGAVATPALNVLVAHDGAGPVDYALTGRSAGVRRAARDWAAIRDIDARAVYLGRLRFDARDRIALTGLAEIADKRDVSLFWDMLDDDRGRIRAAGLRALARVEEGAARPVAVDALRDRASGQMFWAAADVLRRGSPTATEIEALVPVGLNPERPAGQRFRALSLLRRNRWVHLATLLQAWAETEDDIVRRRLDQEINIWIASSSRLTHAPTDEVRQQIDKLLPQLAADQRREIEFVVRTVT